MQPLDSLQTTGTALYGPRWTAPLARMLRRPGAHEPGVDLRLLHHWLGGTPGRPVPAWVPAACAELLRSEAARRSSLLELAEQITAN